MLNLGMAFFIMKLSDYLKEKVKEYCKLKNIPLSGNSVSSEFEREIQDFIGYEIKLKRKTDRQKRQKESKNNISNIVNGFLSKCNTSK